MEFEKNSIDQSVFSVPLFALPNVVMFPRAILPLHLFSRLVSIMEAQIRAIASAMGQMSSANMN